MGRLENYQRQDTKKSQGQRIHPIWRGIGFALIILIPIMAYFTALLLIDLNYQNGWMAIPRDLLVQGKDSMLLIKAILTLVISLLLFLILQIITFFLFRILGPSRYGPLDVPSVRYRGKKYKR
ncbi:MAG: hypothetical protein CVU39_02970 [Chloroflexi bacterium HGW-Chloroflexi-10]|nr:MAG: hypothetical protein CVU39_02970 [Chloroflexi bacterium HGW-Chloroflexi-10]